MEALRSLIRGDLPPVGNSIIHKRNQDDIGMPEFAGYKATWVDSGTSALALAFKAVRFLRPDLSSPEVLIPGYCCPDLLSAAHYAGIKPVLVDINDNDPSFSLTRVRDAISKNTLAIVAINFLGVSEDLHGLSKLKAEFPQLYIVEDNAQWFPSSGEDDLLIGDFVTFSFGRGKPLSLLGGGLLLSKLDLPEAFIQENIEPIADSSFVSRWSVKAKLMAYNQLLNPFFYQMISRNPFISLGNTRYSALEKITSFDDVRRELFTANMIQYNRSSNHIGSCYDQLLSDIHFNNRFSALHTARRRRLLRYPVLFSSVEEKQRVYKVLVEAGLGATEMYRLALPEISGVQNYTIAGSLDNSMAFAERFISLPVHQAVSAVHLKLIRAAFERVNLIF
ncbi:hypothetical protein GCM10011613_28640 [Cellvibrio zantedeschiae]|uniref:DegT/DnrJ/EryC1/StrS aminotransferase family protein n=1 Tax=Cellvibrio zantedeschiae TaxID=1237077 RepID=A0ABQ3B740_9GAMM|nr:DegT/DnrJ/EryC1/StrS family aminotransferase [Cellvibrio zantedeschiae]GGY82179.1 hypothetical protein GCM10011613_28640 [Cellvibrio zantedeschiae]